MKKYVDQIVISQTNWCVPATLEMVLKHHGIDLLSQEDIAKQLDIVAVTDGVPQQKWGAQIKENTLNDFFYANKIQLHEKYIPINHFIDEFFMIEELQKLLDCGVTVICGYNYTSLYGKGEDSFQHVSIITGIEEGGRRVQLLDPGPRSAGYRVVKAETLFYAIKDAKDGLWCIS